MTVHLEEPERRLFVRENTVLTHPPHVPEVLLHLAEDMTLLWQVTEQTLGGSPVEPPYWASAWAGGQAVARYLLDNPEVVAGGPVLDVASGSGLCAIAAALAGAEPVTALDIDPLSVVAVAENAAANGVAVQPLLGDVASVGLPSAGVVLAGDICYERRMAERLLAWLRSCHDRGARVLIGDPGRAFLPEQGLVEVARYAITGDPVLENAGVRHACVYGIA